MNKEEAINIYKELKNNKDIAYSIDKEFFLTFAETVLKELEDNQADLTTVYIKGVCDEKSKWRDKINIYADKLILDINNTLNAEQNTEELKAFYKNQRVKYEAQLHACKDIEELLGE